MWHLSLATSCRLIYHIDVAYSLTKQTDILLTHSEGVVPPVSTAKKRFQIVSCSAHDDMRRRHQCSYDKEHAENGDDDTKPLQKVKVCDFYRLGWAHTENHGNSVQNKEHIVIGTDCGTSKCECTKMKLAHKTIFQ